MVKNLTQMFFFLTHGTSVPVRTLITGRTLISNFAPKAMTRLYVTPAVHTLIWARLRTIFAIVVRRWTTLNINTCQMSDCTYTLGIICYYISFIKCSNVSKHTMFFLNIFQKHYPAVSNKIIKVNWHFLIADNGTKLKKFTRQKRLS